MVQAEGRTGSIHTSGLLCLDRDINVTTSELQHDGSRSKHFIFILLVHSEIKSCVKFRGEFI